ncbi:uncharacterized protein N7515_007017 [Penicillium bovifimosum]|uniref:Uncharacterized protein n=1 Tax=Penicillium bovifimosum TaxID=126998 RepID=A0A9W9GW16_9EURO|nr:uncharacterized protein N7515_007017 [Penicillium bovifimosum]KAJ5130978.1 hypothetical protein N7515_007017 [Penicillium bovifimosum]
MDLEGMSMDPLYLCGDGRRPVDDVFVPATNVQHTTLMPSLLNITPERTTEFMHKVIGMIICYRGDVLFKMLKTKQSQADMAAR